MFYSILPQANHFHYVFAIFMYDDMKFYSFLLRENKLKENENTNSYYF